MSGWEYRRNRGPVIDILPFIDLESDEDYCGASSPIERVYRDGIRVWFKEWLAEFDIDASASGRLLARAFVTLLTDSSVMLMACESDAEADLVIQAAISLIGRLTG